VIRKFRTPGGTARISTFEQFRPSGPEGALPAFAPPERPWHCRPLIPGGDRYSSRGQRPRKTRPQQGPTLKGSNPGGVTAVLRPAAQGDTTLSGSGKERGALRGRCPRLLSCALAGHQKTTVRSYPAAPVSDITDSRFRLSMLRMTCHLESAAARHVILREDVMGPCPPAVHENAPGDSPP